MKGIMIKGSRIGRVQRCLSGYAALTTCGEYFDNLGAWERGNVELPLRNTGKSGKVQLVLNSVSLDTALRK